MDEIEQRTELEAALDEFVEYKLSAANERVLGELLYTAAETGMMDFRLDVDVAVMVCRLVMLAAAFKRCPERFRM